MAAIQFRHVWIGVTVTLVLSGCGSGGPSVTEYADEVEQLVLAMETGFAAADAEWESQAPSVAGAAEYWERRLAVRTEFLESVRSLQPPDEVADMHDTAVDVFTRMTEADEALAERAAGFDEITDHWQWVETPEGRAADAVLEDVYAFCRASQEGFDATRERERFAESDWLPSQMKEVVRVAFGCPE